MVKYLKVLETLRSSGDAAVVEAECTTFANMFLALYQSCMVTSYLHVVQNHCHELVERLGCLNTFTQQQVEKLNHMATAAYFSVTNFKDGMRQVLQQHGRRLILSKMQYMRKLGV